MESLRILVDGDPRNISVKLFQNQSSCLGGVVLRFACFGSGGYHVQWSKMILNNFVRGSPMEYSCEIIYKSLKPFRGRTHLNLVFLFISYFFKPLRSSCSADWNDLSNFDRWNPKEHSCETISKSLHPFPRSRLTVFFFWFFFFCFFFFYF